MGGSRVIIIIGSGRDEEFTKRIIAQLEEFQVPYNIRVASAHKTPTKLLKIIEEHASGEERIVYITVAGRSNAMSGFVDANTTYPVIACPPYSNTFSGQDIYSSLRMPSGVCPMVILEPESAALAAIKILGIHDTTLREKVQRYQSDVREKVEEADVRIHSSYGDV